MKSNVQCANTTRDSMDSQHQNGMNSSDYKEEGARSVMRASSSFGGRVLSLLALIILIPLAPLGAFFATTAIAVLVSYLKTLIGYIV